jgi:hypothetical protein
MRRWQNNGDERRLRERERERSEYERLRGGAEMG